MRSALTISQPLEYDGRRVVPGWDGQLRYGPSAVRHLECLTSLDAPQQFAGALPKLPDPNAWHVLPVA
jgi:hypothetical protein